MVDDSLADVREQVDVYSSRVKELESIHIDILGYVSTSNDRLAFLDQLSNELLTRLQAASDELNTEKKKQASLTNETADLRARLADAEDRLTGVLAQVRDFEVRIATATRDKNAAEQQLMLGKQQDQENLRDLSAMITSRTNDQMSDIRDLESQLYTANKTLEAVTAQMQQTKAIGARLQTERDVQADALKAREKLVAESIKRSGQLNADQTDFSTLLNATNRVSQIPDVRNATG